MLSSPKTTPDSVIIENIRKDFLQRRKAETILFEKYHGFVKEGIRKHQLSEYECVSIYSDTIIAVIESIVNNRFEGRSELKTYIFQIFSNKCVDQIRKNTTNRASVHQTYTLSDDFPLSDNSKTIIQQLILESEIEKLYKKLSLIGEKCKQMILLWGESYSDQEIADQLGYNSSSVAKTSRLRCLEKLKEKY